jgi:di/tricarboxylate transporter
MCTSIFLVQALAVTGVIAWLANEVKKAGPSDRLIALLATHRRVVRA